MRLRDEVPATIAISGQGDPPRTLLSLDVVDGKLVATYDQADLDEAAKVFVDYLVKSFGPGRWSDLHTAVHQLLLLRLYEQLDTPAGITAWNDVITAHDNECDA